MALKRSTSDALFEDACQHLVGGVNSPVRAFQAVGGRPFFVAKAKGAVLVDVDGNRYVDFVGAWGPMLFGHAFPPVLKAVREALPGGVSFGAPTSSEVELARLIKDAFPSIALLRFTTSGTEAVMTAIRLARGATRRDRILKFAGGYHGHSDAVLVAAGSGATTFGVPSSAGVPASLAQNTWVLPYNDTAGLEDVFRTQGPNIAAAIVEPVCGNMGVVPARPAFLQRLQKLTRRYGVVLIFDEVMTGFRLSWGGAQELFGIRPDLTCLGKIIGGGFPVGAVGGASDLMSQLAPLGPVYQAGTLSGNPVATAAGLAMLRQIRARNPYEELAMRTTDLADFLRAAAKRAGVPVRVNQIGSMFSVFFTDQPVDSYLSASFADGALYAVFFQALLERGVFFPPSHFEAAFVSTAHNIAVIDRTKAAIEAALRAVAGQMRKTGGTHG